LGYRSNQLQAYAKQDLKGFHLDPIESHEKNDARLPQSASKGKP
jgi:hypothetical protein